MFNIVKKRTYFYIFSSLLVVLSIVSIFTWKLNLGIDFRGGSVIEISAPGLANNSEKIKEAASASGIEIDSIRNSGSDKVILRSRNLSAQEHDDLIANLKNTVDPSITEDNYQTIGPVVSRDLTNKAIWSVVIATIAIILYIAFAFRKVPKPASSWRFGITAVVALLHDLIVTTGFVSVVGHFYKFMQVDSLFITALLTIMGFSVHDTIVVFDRLRENLIRHPNNNLETLANDSILQTISRSINTSLTTILVLVTLFVIGGESIGHFVLILIAGITFGTYSSIFIATMLLVSWSKSAKAKAVK
ncbi:protein translocase subunit SecF [Candidatus Berkelbacteria bacterium CG_4_9_14_0_2_um_filter_42_30]|uniref:Protein-export membrane protein SecF n=4 Tax=Candidatus Berkelbacteria TaxID=1618330 RepID=A0A2H0B1J5_9BACT|nr:MAG: protein-export membrane protein SecF [Candidatus Berkelbacteria bacterium CG1_02_42_45]PIP50788.1 MAG: protein translocase subunit SecF [Candidatus Berkelbacteria bacterium CG23_combo_of_CG06-09_8_20_14_all_41_73]PIZ27528.1 MAG: protein translocase subunit SecF [Candidatus Berkelbacteria bacterium CG_4_10_14_0_8_um_filter_42_34]PJC65757.1 MAG: protein translocase subunit SecF [Candidatus Berkelbacteria bacterium CG_4_9_14_0_2_um_filter_42_30]